jgi:hypothetical protein
VVQRVLWASNTYGIPAIGVRMQTDGNLVIYKQGGGYSWASNTGGRQWDTYRLVAQDDGNVVIYTSGGTYIWETVTWSARNTESWGDSRGAGDCWRPGTPWTCVHTWSGRSAAVYFRAIDQFSSSEPNWLTGASAAVSAWNNAPGPQYYSFTPSSNDTWVFLKTTRTGQNGIPPGRNDVAGISSNCNTYMPGGPCFQDYRPMNAEWSEVYINRDYFANCTYPACNANLQHVFADESGHAMMLAHNPLDVDAIMYPSNDPRTQFPNANDIGANPDCYGGGFGMRCIYGSW